MHVIANGTAEENVFPVSGTLGHIYIAMGQMALFHSKGSLHTIWEGYS